MNDEVMTVDLQMKVNTYLDIYGKTLRVMKMNNPEKFDEELRAAKDRAERGWINAIVEMLAMISIEYEFSIQTNTVSDFTTMLLNYKEINEL